MAFYQISLESYVIMPNGGGHLGFFINMKNKLSSIVSSFQFVSLRDFVLRSKDTDGCSCCDRMVIEFTSSNVTAKVVSFLSARVNVGSKSCLIKCCFFLKEKNV
jgi:hypothetical protein